jgi:hypothetical protein
MVFKLGTMLHAKGFIINKLFDDNRIGHRHLPVELLPNGYPLKYRHLVKEAFELLKSENPSPLQVAPHRTGSGTSLHVCLVPTRLWPKGVRGLMNGYRKSVGRQPYGKDLKTLLPLRRR